MIRATLIPAARGAAPKASLRAALAGLAVLAGCAQPVQQPQPPRYLLDEFAAHTLALTGGMLCKEHGYDMAAGQEAYVQVFARMKSEGWSDAEIEALMARMKEDKTWVMPYLNGFAAKHGIADDDLPGFCRAIATEKRQKTKIAALLN